MGPVRAKFRYLNYSVKYDGWLKAELGPVMNRKSENFEENKKFWQASPYGECVLHYNGECDLELGAYYHIDMEPDEDGAWTLGQVADCGNGSGEVQFSYHRQYDYRKEDPKGLRSGELKIGIDGNHTDALAAFGKAGTKWKVSITFADPSDD